MDSPTKFEKLKKHILSRSVCENDFMAAKLEWDLFDVLLTKDFGNCPCGQKILEHCFLKNRKNGRTTWVGNVCVKKFMDIDSGTLFDGLKRLRKDNSARPNRMLTEHAYKKGFLYGENEYEFLLNINRKRKISEKQESWLRKINRRILEKITVRELPDQDDETNDQSDENREQSNQESDLVQSIDSSEEDSDLRDE